MTVYYYHRARCMINSEDKMAQTDRPFAHSKTVFIFLPVWIFRRVKSLYLCGFQSTEAGQTIQYPSEVQKCRSIVPQSIEKQVIGFNLLPVFYCTLYGSYPFSVFC